MCGWEEYKVMQKETSEYRSQMMQAMRANDKKQMETLKKKQSQIDPISFSYIIIWYLFLIPVFGGNAVAYVPGIAPAPGGIPVFIWYMICSLFFGTLSSRIAGVTPIT
jgi:uncharacterized membrane protein (DUF106 family)